MLDIQRLAAAAGRYGSSLRIVYRDLTRSSPDWRLQYNRDRQEFRWSGGGPRGGATVCDREIWLRSPEMRVEIRYEGIPVCIGVRTDDQWWRWKRGDGVLRGPEDKRRPTAPPLLDPIVLNPHRLFAGVRVQITGYGHRAGRDVIAARCTVKARGANGLPTAYELEMDRDLGLLLRFAAFSGPYFIRSTEALMFHEGEPMDDRLFAIPPKMSGEENRLADRNSSPWDAQ
jgi:hypothetical protein